MIGLGNNVRLGLKDWVGSNLCLGSNDWVRFRELQCPG